MGLDTTCSSTGLRAAIGRSRPVKRLTVAFAALLVASVVTVVASADSTGTIGFEAGSGYSPGDINGQNGWSNTGGFDADVVSVTGGQALQISDAKTSGSFGDQTFSPALVDAASESGNRHFTASFTIGTATAAPNDGLHLSISPDNGQGGRMSYLRFEYQNGDNKVHVFFDDSDQSAACTPAGCASFRESELSGFAPGTTHTFKFDVGLVPGTNGGVPNDVVNVYEDGVLAHTGTTWEGYYRYDPESGPASPPAIRSLIFKEGGTENPADAGAGFLIDDIALASSATAVCTPTGFHRDGLDLTAAQIGGTVTGTLDATGCNIGAYNPVSVTNAEIYGANYYGVVVNASAADVTDTSVHDIGETPLNGTQHGVGILYTTIDQNGHSTGAAATGTISGTTITNYQKNGIVISGAGANATVSGNTVTGQGHVDYIAQNGIQVSFGASALVKGNQVTGNWYTPSSFTACGLLFFQAAGVKQQANSLSDNETNLCNAGRGGGHYNP